jgi:cysteine synthase
MFNRTKGIKESTLDSMRVEAMNAEDYDTVIKLNDIESEIQTKMLKERLKGIFGGYSSAMAGFAIGAVLVNTVKSKRV